MKSHGFNCLKCTHIIICKNKREYHKLFGRNCPECGGAILPVVITIDRARGKDITAWVGDE